MQALKSCIRRSALQQVLRGSEAVCWRTRDQHVRCAASGLPVGPGHKAAMALEKSLEKEKEQKVS